MYRNLSKKEKQSKLAQARKRAILWSSQEQRRKNLQATEPVAQLSTTTTTPIFYPAASELSNDDLVSKPIPLKQNTPATTIAALQASISDLQEQREQLDITIRVLQHRLNYLLSITSQDE